MLPENGVIDLGFSRQIHVEEYIKESSLSLQKILDRRESEKLVFSLIDEPAPNEANRDCIDIGVGEIAVATILDKYQDSAFEVKIYSRETNVLLATIAARLDSAKLYAPS